jgi:putative oxidoreductase
MLYERAISPSASLPALPARAFSRKGSTMGDFDSYAAAAGRLLLVTLFFVSGLGKLAAPAATKTYIVAMGLPFPAVALWISILVELGGGVLFLIGYHTRIVALGLALYSIATALIFHHHLADQNQMLHFLKDLAIAGGFLQVAAFGGGALSLDARGAGQGY